GREREVTQVLCLRPKIDRQGGQVLHRLLVRETCELLELSSARMGRHLYLPPVSRAWTSTDCRSVELSLRAVSRTPLLRSTRSRRLGACRKDRQQAHMKCTAGHVAHQGGVASSA